MKNNNGCIIVLIYLICIPPSMMWSGFVASKLWLWFITAQFHVPPMSLAGAIGLSTFITMFKTIPKPDKDDDSAETLTRAVTAAVFTPAISLGVGYIVTLFM